MAVTESKRLKLSEKVVNDIVHGIIKLPDYIQAIIDTEQFQRLRYISQLGVVKFVYPTAGYSRFEHSIGTFHLASQLIRQIKKQLVEDDAEICVSNFEVKCVEIAALCHDLGHGPYSHFWEQAFDGIQLAGGETIKPRQHEELSAEIFELLIKIEKSGQPIKNQIGLTNDNVDLIKRLISGKFDENKDNKKYFLFEIVANKKSGLDVDKFDYLCRDSIYLGWSNKNKIHDIKRIIQFLRVAKDENKEWHLAMRDREIFHIYDVFYYRHLVHRYGCHHKTVKAIECMFKQAIKQIVENSRAEFIGNVVGGENAGNVENIFFSAEFISKVCDHHVWEIMKKYTSDIVKQIQERNVFKLHCQIQVFRKENNGNIRDDVKSLIETIKQLPVVADVATSKFSLQSENKGNPLLAVRFYKKSDNLNCIQLKEEDLPDLVKLKTDEFIMMIFTNNLAKDENIKSLNEIIELLYMENINETHYNAIRVDDAIKTKLLNEIKKLREKYKFRKNLY